MQKLWFKVLFIVLVISAVASTQKVLGAEEQQANEELESQNNQFNSKQAENWEIRLMPYVYFLSIDAEGTINGLSGNVDLSFGDIVDNLDFGAMGRVEAWKGKWGFIFDGLFMNLSKDGSFSRQTRPHDFFIRCGCQTRDGGFWIGISSY